MEKNNTVYIVDDHTLVGDPSIEIYNNNELKALVDYFEKLYHTKDNRALGYQSIRIFWNKEEAEEYREKIRENWETINNNKDRE
jgi:hypothetical protein